MVEILGYSGLAVLIVALLQNNIFQLRVFGLWSALLFFIQALMLESHSLMLTNVTIASIHIYMIYKMLREDSRRKQELEK